MLNIVALQCVVLNVEHSNITVCGVECRTQLQCVVLNVEHSNITVCGAECRTQ